MPKFEKGSEEAKEHMRILRERRQARPLTELQISRNNKKNEVKNILNDALETYFMAGSAIVEVPEKVVKLDKKGNTKIIKTLTKSGNLTKVNGESVIKLESGNDLIVKNKGRKFNDAVNLPTTTITHNKPIKTNRIKKPDDDKIENDTIEIDNIEIEPEKIIHNKPIKKSRSKKIPDDDKVLNDIIDFETKKIGKQFFWPDKYMNAKDDNDKLIQDFKPSSNYVAYNKIAKNNIIIDTIDKKYIEFLKNELNKKLITKTEFNKIETEINNDMDNRNEKLNELLSLIKNKSKK